MGKIKWFIAAVALLSFNSCSVIAGIFKAGVWVGAIIVIAIVAIVIYIISRIGNKN